MAEKGGKDTKPKPEPGPKHKIFVDEVEYIVNSNNLTGAQIKELSNTPMEYQLFLEQAGDDQQITDSYTVKIHSNMKFYSLPPATFG